MNSVSWLLPGPLWRIRGDSLLKGFWAHSPNLEGILGTLPALPKFVVVSQNAELSTRHIRVCSESEHTHSERVGRQRSFFVS